MKYELYIGKHCHTITGPDGLAIHFIADDLAEAERVARLMFESVNNETTLSTAAIAPGGTMRDLVDIAGDAESWCGSEDAQASDAAGCSTAGPRCHCGSTNTVPTGLGGYQAPDASKGDPGAEGDEYGCNDCGRCFAW